MLKLSDSRNFGRTFAALGLVLGPLLFLLSTLLAPAFAVAPENPNVYLDRVGENPVTHLLAAVLFFAGGLLLVPGLMGTVHLLRGRRVTFGQAAAALVLLDVALLGFYVLQVVELAMTGPGAERAQMAALFGRIDEGLGGTIFFAVFGLGIVPGLLLLALALFLRRAVPVWGPVALVLSVVVGFFPDNRTASAIEFALLLVGAAAIALRIWGLSDEEWERWRPLPDSVGRG